LPRAARQAGKLPKNNEKDGLIRLQLHAGALHRRAKERQEQRRAVPGRGRAKRGAREGNQRRFGQILTHEAQRSGANRGPHRELVLTLVQLREHQASDVDAAQEQHHRDEALHQI
jgi:hypothetical protein